MPKRDTSVVWFHSEMAGAPIMRGQAGAMIELLDACLLNGFDTKTINTLAVSAGVATATISAGHTYNVESVIEISGASIAALNDKWRVDTADGTTLAFACPGVADGTATGTITAKRAPAGWVKPFADTNKGVYQSADLTSTQLYLRVDDADARFTRVRGYENMTGIDAGTGPFPTLAQHTEVNFTWRKSGAAGTAARPWTVIADGLLFWVLIDGTPGTGKTANFFGDIVPVAPALDAYNCGIIAHTTASPNNSGASHAGASSGQNGRFLARNIVGAAGAINVRLMVPGVNDWTAISLSPKAPGFGGEVFVGPFPFVQEGIQIFDPVRGLLPGPRTTFQRDIVADNAIYTDADVPLLGVQTNRGASGTTSSEVALFQIVGPWR